MMRKLLYVFCCTFLFACTSTDKTPPPLFKQLPAEKTGVYFSNELTFLEDFNPYIFKNFFNGGGVAVGDLNNDGLADLFFCGNMVENKLYLNRGNFEFEDITKKAKVSSGSVWSSGVSFADVNGDGWLDIYVCKSGKPGGELRHNELFINKGIDATGNLQFEEKAKEYDIADEGLSAHAAFFDYDKDGDLDMYLLNNSLRPVGGFDIRPGLREIRDPFGGNKLYRNELISEQPQAKFVDVSEAAGIYGSTIGYGLGVTIGDVNRDGWQDIHISNDFFERDYLYINQQDGTFKEDLVNQINEISAGSMGADMADINNDGYPEIFVTDMLPETEERYKSKMTFENWDKYALNVANGYHRQFTRNVLQLNNKNGTFSEIGRLAGVHASDWSWSALIADYDNDGYKDIYVTNGIYQDLMDQDYINYYATDPKIIGAIRNREEGAILKLLDQMPSEPIPNYAFRNNKDLTFTNTTKTWGLATPSFSNGAAYSDLDNDGDLDLVVNNVNMPAFIYKNLADTLLNNNYLKIQLTGNQLNTKALGTQVTLKAKGQTFYQELVTSKGFQSSIDYCLNFGLGTIDNIDSIIVQWPTGGTTLQTNIAVNQTLNIAIEGQQIKTLDVLQAKRNTTPPLLRPTQHPPFEFMHQESKFNDFNRDRLLYQMLSAEGPALAKGDVNGDGLDDIFIGSAARQASALWIQKKDGQFEPSNTAIFKRVRPSEDTDALFFDADGDQDLDLYVAKGSNEFQARNQQLIDRFYINDGKGNFTESPNSFPTSVRAENTACVRAADFDQDGDLDLFIGVRLRAGLYGFPASSYLLENDGKGNFTDITKNKATALSQTGMVTDAIWTDTDNDQDLDLVVVGDWMPIKIFENEAGSLTYKPTLLADDFSNGFWNCIQAGDFNQDGFIDFVIGNQGQNSRFKASQQEPITLYLNDFDNNRTPDPIISIYNNGESYPLVLRHDLVMQLPTLKKKYLYYKDYKGQKVADIFDENGLKNAIQSTVYTTHTSIALNNGNGIFTLKSLPVEAQFAPVRAILVDDFNKDQNPDILLGGNFHYAKPEVGIYDASYGLLLQGDGTGHFSPLSAKQSGFSVKGMIRRFAKFKVQGRELLLVVRNNDSVLFYDL